MGEASRGLSSNARASARELAQRGIVCVSAGGARDPEGASPPVPSSAGGRHPRSRRVLALSWLGALGLLLGSTATAHADALADLEGSMRGALASGSWASALGMAFAAGVATSLTPCVYPMIVITVSVFGARQATSKLAAAKLSAMFVLGIAALFTPLGVIAALTGDVFGSQLSNPIVLIALALFFLALAASMLGAFELDLPAGLKNRLAMTGGDGLKGAFVLGMVNSLIAAPCTGPVVGFMLTWVGTTRDVAFGAASFFSYSIGLGLLFFMVGTFSMSLPKSGNWLEGIKAVFGIVMIAAAVYFVRDLIPGLNELASRTSTFLGVSLALIAAGVVIGGVHLSFHGASTLQRIRKSAGIAIAATGLCGIVGYLQALPEGAKLAWSEDWKAAQQLASTSGKPILLDFGASWCGACEELNRYTFSDPRVVREGQRFVSVKVDLSPGKDSPEKQKLLASYGHRGLPLVVLHDSEGKEAARVTQFVEADKFLALMKPVK
jgi:thiol:disulfide interchange protein DsbD